MRDFGKPLFLSALRSAFASLRALDRSFKVRCTFMVLPDFVVNLLPLTRRDFLPLKDGLLVLSAMCVFKNSLSTYKYSKMHAFFWSFDSLYYFCILMSYEQSPKMRRKNMHTLHSPMRKRSRKVTNMSKQLLSEELSWRGFVNQTTYDSPSALDKGQISFYWGVDPSADSMQIGNLAAAMMVRHFIEHGHKAVLLVGGATGMIGDPDGKSQERDLLTIEQIEANKKAITSQYKKVFAGQKFTIVDNYDWFKGIGFLEFLRDVGKHVPMRQMLGREFVQSRLREDGAGISYAEFSYSLIQGYDFLHLHREYGVSLQLCGADQWGNSIAGVELIRRIDGSEANIWSAPLVINRATGKKFGKSEDGAVWLDEAKTSVYKFYQFWINVGDDSVEELLKIYTLLSRNTIESIMKQQHENPGGRIAQKTLAFEVTSLVHGKQRATSVQNVSEVLFGGKSYKDLRATDFQEIEQELPNVVCAVDTDIVDILVAVKLASSKGEARRFLEGNAIYINGQQIPLAKTTIDETDFIEGFCVVRRGKNGNALVKRA